MYVRYRKDVRPSQTVYTEAQYTCMRARAQFGVGTCQSVAASKVDRVVQEVFLRALEPAKLEVSLDALDRLEEQSRGAERHWELRLERARYEALHAQRQYDCVDPENRIVAGELERRWNEKLEGRQKLEGEFAEWKQKRQKNWTSEEIQELKELVKDVRVVWDAPTTTHEERKNLLRVLIEEVQLRTDRERRRMELRILWRGEVQTIHEVPWSVGGPSPQYEVVELVERWVAIGDSDAEIAAGLNAKGLRPRRGGIFTPGRIGELRGRFGIVSRWRGQRAPGPAEEGWCSMPEAKERLGVCKDTILVWINSGLIEAKRSEDGCHWWMRLGEKELARLKGGWNPEEDWTVKQAAAHLKVAQPTIYGWVAKGWLPARALKKGPKHRLAIPRSVVDTVGQKLRDKTSAHGGPEDA
jgi:hypothetical protein